MATGRRSESRDRAELLLGTLEMLIMQTLRSGPQHGHGIGLSISVCSDDLLHVEAGSLYPALHRMEAKGLIVSAWKLSDKNQRAKFYRLTAAGRRQLAREESKWDLLVDAVTRVRRSGTAEASG